MLSPILAKTPGRFPALPPRPAIFSRWPVTTGPSTGTTGSSSRSAAEASWLKAKPSASRTEATREVLRSRGWIA